ncbi:MAG: hypothetical protein ABR514_11215, partial [Chthoniobacterales bacterium]
ADINCSSADPAGRNGNADCRRIAACHSSSPSSSDPICADHGNTNAETNRDATGVIHLERRASPDIFATRLAAAIFSGSIRYSGCGRAAGVRPH